MLDLMDKNKTIIFFLCTFFECNLLVGLIEVAARIFQVLDCKRVVFELRVRSEETLVINHIGKLSAILDVEVLDAEVILFVLPYRISLGILVKFPSVCTFDVLC